MPAPRGIGVACLIAVLGGSPSGAAVIRVAPGPGTPVQDAIDAAAPGDTVRLSAGTYREVLSIQRPLRLLGAGAERVTIDANCTFGAAISIAAERVTVRGMRVIGGLLNEIEILQGDHITIADTVTLGHLFALKCSSEEAGIAVANASRVRLVRNRAAGFFTAGIWLAGASPDDAPLRVIGNALTGNATGILVQAFGAPVRALVRANDVSSNLSNGIILDGADGARVLGNTVRDNRDTGIWLTGTTASVVDGNQISGHTADVRDDGATNCWRRNSFTTGTPPVGPC